MIGIKETRLVEYSDSEDTLQSSLGDSDSEEEAQKDYNDVWNWGSEEGTPYIIASQKRTPLQRGGEQLEETEEHTPLPMMELMEGVRNKGNQNPTVTNRAFKFHAPEKQKQADSFVWDPRRHQQLRHVSVPKHTVISEDFSSRDPAEVGLFEISGGGTSSTKEVMQEQEEDPPMAPTSRSGRVRRQSTVNNTLVSASRTRTPQVDVGNEKKALEFLKTGEVEEAFEFMKMKKKLRLYAWEKEKAEDRYRKG